MEETIYPGLYTQQEIAKITGLTYETVRKRISRRFVKPVKLIGSTKLYDESSLQMIAKGRHQYE